MIHRGKKRFTYLRESRIISRRSSAFYLIFIIVFGVLVFRLFDLQIIRHQFFIKKAEAIHQTEQVLSPLRGDIYFVNKNQNLIPVAINKQYFAIYAVPKDITQPQEVSKQLAKILPLPEEEIFSHLNKPGDPYELLVKKTEDKALVKKIEDLSIKGIHIQKNFYRYYPFKSLASQTIGFVSQTKKDSSFKGRYGLESYYDDILAGRAGLFKGSKDALGRLIITHQSLEKDMTEGASLITTIDKNVQFATEEALKKLITGRQAQGGSIIVMDPYKGKIIALANYPTFDLNQYDKVKDYSVYQNAAVESRYEPGSVIKPITMAAGLDLHAVTPHTTYVDKGYYDVGGHRLVNYKHLVFGKVDMNKVLEMSIDTGAIFVERLIGGNSLRRYFKRFGLNQKTGIDLPGEIEGNLSNIEYPKSNPTYFATASFGVGISVTPMELIRAYAAILNNGRSVTPYIVDEIKDSHGTYKAMNKPESVQVISPKTAQTLKQMLIDVIEKGYGWKAKVKGYSLGGKTGTAFIALTNGRGYSKDVSHTFVGFFPAYKPKFLILVHMARPQWGKDSASHTVTLAFKDVEKFLINYYNIPPDEEQ